jgi:hypothetical protein
MFWFEGMAEAVIQEAVRRRHPAGPDDPRESPTVVQLRRMAGTSPASGRRGEVRLQPVAEVVLAAIAWAIAVAPDLSILNLVGPELAMPNFLQSR